MKILKMITPKKLVAWIALLLMTVFLWSGVSVFKTSAEEAVEETVTYIDTDVKNIVYSQHPSVVFLGFELTESDYDDYGLFEGDFGGQPSYTAYENYIALTLTYWKDFSSMNSEEKRFDQLYAYWNGSSVGPAKFANTIAHRTNLRLLEYGFMVSIPAGTTFPSLTYVKNNCEGTPIMYRTTQDRAFYFDGTSFVELSYAIAEKRAEANSTVQGVKYSQYNTEERAQVKALVEETTAALKLCFTVVEINDIINDFYAKLDAIMTIADYEALEVRKTEVKAELATFFAGFSEANYLAEEWASLQALHLAGDALIDSIKLDSELDAAVQGIQYSANSILTAEEKAGLAAYAATVAQRLETSFVQSLYRDAERAQGLAIVEEGVAAIEAAASYEEVDGLEGEYIARIAALKTDAQLTEEENSANAENSTPEVDEPTQDKDDIEIPPSSVEEEEGGCSDSINGINLVLGVLVAMALIITKNKKRMEN